MGNLAMNQPSTANLPLRHVRQRGVVLFISLIVLVAMSLAGIAAWRSVSTGLLIAGNMAFQQGATLSADKGLEAARAWLTNAANANLLTADQASGYYSTWQSTFNATTFNWAALSTSTGAADAAGNSVSYVIHRMCGSAGAYNLPPPQQCVATMGSDGTINTEIPQGLQGSLQLYYRVTVRVTGPRNTVSYVQSTMY